MVVAINTRFLLKHTLEGYGYFIKEVFGRLAVQYPEHQFYYLFDRPYDTELHFPQNVTPLVVPPPARHPILWKYWYDVKIPRILKKIKADVFVSPDGFCSLTTGVPQCLVLHDLGFLHYPEAYKKMHALYYKRFTGKFLRKADTVATVSETSKNDILQNYRISPDKIDVIYSAAKEVFQPLDIQQQAAVKEKYTEGKEYLIYAGAIHPRKNLINLLKAFSIFKKRQRSNMKLVLTGRLAWKNKEFLNLLDSYKFKTDVILTGYVEEAEILKLIGAAYALVYPSRFEGFGLPVLEAMKCNVPALTTIHTSMQEVAKDAALYFNATDPQDIADKLMLIYKDENLRKQLIERGSTISKKYSWQRTAGLLWNCISKALPE
ncbi:MAG: glycosyltransferase family 4 protein [Chitinophagaceae bacterium]